VGDSPFASGSRNVHNGESHQAEGWPDVRQSQLLTEAPMTLHPIPEGRGRHAAGTPIGSTFITHQCALCTAARVSGGLLSSRPDIGDGVLWVCEDCQRKLMRGLDDQGALGG